MYVTEGTLAGTLIGTLIAFDPDADQIGTLSVLSGNTQDAFTIDPLAYTVTVNNAASIRVSNIPIYAISLNIKDDGTPQMSTNATLTVIVKSSTTTTSTTTTTRKKGGGGGGGGFYIPTTIYTTTTTLAEVVTTTLWIPETTTTLAQDNTGNDNPQSQGNASSGADNMGTNENNHSESTNVSTEKPEPYTEISSFSGKAKVLVLVSLIVAILSAAILLLVHIKRDKKGKA